MAPSIASHVLFDTSLVGAYLFKEDHSPVAQAAFDAVFEGRYVACVPSLFWAELQQLMHLKLQRETRLDIEFLQEYALSLGLVELPGDPFPPSARRAVWSWMSTLRLGPSDPYFVGSYDCYYLNVALQRGMCLWTLDRKFRDRAHTDAALKPFVMQVGLDVHP